jgi:peptide/nickel transport system substrate-binding protein
MKLKTALLGAAALATFAPAAWAERGADGEVKLTFPQAVSIMNPYLSSGTKDIFAASMVIEPLAGYDDTGALIAKLVSEIPSVENGGISEDLTSITWKLLPGLLWADGSPVTAADVVFTGQYCMDPAGGCAQLSKFDGIKSIEVED